MYFFALRTENGQRAAFSVATQHTMPQEFGGKWGMVLMRNVMSNTCSMLLCCEAEKRERIFYHMFVISGVSNNVSAAISLVSEHGANNFATIRTTSIVTKQQKEHNQVIFRLFPSFICNVFVFLVCFSNIFVYITNCSV